MNYEFNKILSRIITRIKNLYHGKVDVAIRRLKNNRNPYAVRGELEGKPVGLNIITYNEVD